MGVRKALQKLRGAKDLLGAQLPTLFLYTRLHYNISCFEDVGIQKTFTKAKGALKDLPGD